MKLSTQRIAVLGSALACLAMSGLAVQQFKVSPSPQPLALQDGADEPAPVPLGHGYERRGDSIFFKDKRIDQAGRAELDRFELYLGRRVQPANAIDVASFEVLSEQYTKDEFAVYYKWISPGWYCIVEIVGADPATFEALDLDLARDAKHVFRADEVFPDGDPATAEVVTANFVWKDRNTVFYKHIPMEGADPRTFRHLDQAFYRDAKHVYWSNDRLVGADPDTFITFGDVPYAVDTNRVWVTMNRRDDLDAASFRLFQNHVFADRNGVYVTPAAHQVRGADVESFEKVGPIGELGCTLFRDRESLFILEPMYNEMYRLSKEAGEIVVSKDAWVTRNGKIVLGAKTTATWTGEAFSKAVAKVAPGFARTGHVYAAQEEGKIEWLAGTLKAAIEQTGYPNDR